MKIQSTKLNRVKQPFLVIACVSALAASVSLVALSGCRASPAKESNTKFFTSGSREADQRASQRMAQSEQLTGSGEGTGQKGVKKAKVAKTEAGGNGGGAGGQTNKAAQAQGKLSLFQRLGGEVGISNIVSDFTLRALDDPRVNWERTGIKQGGFSLKAGKSVAWNPSAENVEKLKRHLAEFLTLATGGPARYTGKDIEATHADMHITNPQFDAVVGDLKASLDKLQIPNLEQKELLAIVESTRPQIVTVR